MKQIISKVVLAVILALPYIAGSQTSVASKFFDQYSGKDGYTSVDISMGLFELFAQIEADDPEFDEFQKAVKGIESMRLLAYSVSEGKGTLAEKEQFMKNVKSNVPLCDFQELMVVKDKDAKINFYAKNDKQIITEMIMIVDGTDEAVLLSLYGNIDLNQIARLGSSLQLNGMEYLNKMHHE